MRYKVTVAYQGTNYHGWQKQSNHPITIQAAIEASLTKIFNQNIEIYASGRTDAGVHALNQVFHFDANKEIKEFNLFLALNTYLNQDIRIQKVEIVSEDFHARFSAKEKVYLYQISSEYLNPFKKDSHYLLRQELNITKMQEAASLMIGTHDFTSYTSAKINPLKSRTRTIYAIEFKKVNQDLFIEIRANSFLRYMVRMLLATIVEIGKENIEINEIVNILNQKNKKACRYKLPPQGLYLKEVIY